MRIFFVICIAILNSAIVSGQFAEFSFSEKVLKIPPSPEGPSLSFEFPFTNSGEVPLIISEYKVQCTCTVVEYPKEPILPGQSGVIHVHFDTKGKTGWQYRQVRLYANTKKGMDEIEFRVKIVQ